MAHELIELYAKREQSKGFAFYADDEIQRDFEERFPYVETDDQMQSINEIKADMERIRPMDRLLCGDVGFGKTEVALRAAMKCVLSGKQCAILVPTTVLAWQHYQTALRRFEHFPVNIELLSRYRSPKQQTEIIEKLKKGSIDILIGTHKIIQKSVVFKDLGLAIIDEEQRFGVAHKEKFKQTFSGIDVLTLSATPIPRTLNMAMSGIRDMSVIEEPPQDRHPVQTYVVEFNQAVILQAIARELKRGGQLIHKGKTVTVRWLRENGGIAAWPVGYYRYRRGDDGSISKCYPGTVSGRFSFGFGYGKSSNKAFVWKENNNCFRADTRKKYPFFLITGRTHQTGTMTQYCRTLSGLETDTDRILTKDGTPGTGYTVPVLLMNTYDGKRHGISSGNIITLESPDKKTVCGKAFLSESIRKGVIKTSFGQGGRTASSEQYVKMAKSTVNVNELYDPSKVNKTTGMPAFGDIVVRIIKKEEDKENGS